MLQDRLNPELAGHLIYRNRVTWPDKNTLYAPAGLDPMLDVALEHRLMARWRPMDGIHVEAHHEAHIEAGGSIRRERRLKAMCPGVFTDEVLAGATEDRRLFDLTNKIDADAGHILFHRLDRLNVSWTPEWGTIGLGRQAATWGNGMIFNPMDLINPFAPTEVERDYKMGDDMLSIQAGLEHGGDVHFLAAPRRDVASGEVRLEESSAAVKLRAFKDELEFAGLLAAHCEDVVVGGGGAGYLGEAAWRVDATWTALRERSRGKRGFFSLVANIDYTWICCGRNFYGFLEYHRHGLSNNNYREMLFEPAMSERLGRGDTYLLGSDYAAAHVGVELHPLWRASLTAIVNLHDGSALFLPGLAWNMDQDWELTLGAEIPCGETGSEFGGFEAFNEIRAKPATSAYLWLGWFF